jgi:hypothetical protein
MNMKYVIYNELHRAYRTLHDPRRNYSNSLSDAAQFCSAEEAKAVADKHEKIVRAKGDRAYLPRPPSKAKPRKVPGRRYYI